MMGVKKLRRSYTKEFKLETVRLADTSGKPTTQIAAELGISTAQIYNWHRQYITEPESGFKNESQHTKEQQRTKQLELEVARLREERDILKKAAAFFTAELRLKYAFISTHKMWPVKTQCRCLKASRSGYYRWLKAPLESQEMRYSTQTKDSN
jgi:transposase-like protein